MKLSIKLIALSALLLTLAVINSCKKEEKTKTYVFETTSRFAYYAEQAKKKNLSSSKGLKPGNAISAVNTGTEKCNGALDYSFPFNAQGVPEQLINNLKFDFREQLRFNLNQTYPGIYDVTPTAIYYTDGMGYVQNIVKQEIINTFNEVSSRYPYNNYGMILQQYGVQVIEYGVLCTSNPNSNPNPGDGSGGGNGGGNNPSNPNNPTNPNTPPTTVIKNPCNEAFRIKVVMSDPIIVSQINELRAKNNGNEWGFAQTLTALDMNSIYKNTLIHTDNLPGEVSTQFSWNSVNGYTIGSAHNHPGNGGPSYVDIFSIYQQYIQTPMQNDTERSFYKLNATVTIVTANSTYVVSITDWNAYDAAWWNYNQNKSAYEADYQDRLTGLVYEYGINDQEAGFILNLLAFNDIATIYERKNGTQNFIPLRAGLLNGVPTHGPRGGC